MMLLATTLVCLAAVVNADYVRSGQQVMYLPDHKGLVTLDQARSYCSLIGGVIPFHFDVKTRNDIGLLFRNASFSTLWMDVAEAGGNYIWSEDGSRVPADLWKAGEPTFNGTVVLIAGTITEAVGLYVTDRTNGHLTVCALTIRDKGDIKQLQQKWSSLPPDEAEPLEAMLIDLKVNESGLEKQVQHLTRVTGMLLRLVQKLIAQ